MGPEVQQRLFTGAPFTAATLQQYQVFAPDHAFVDTWRSLVDHPEHPPLYYLLAWIWAKLLRPSVASFRSLSVLFSLLTLPALALLAGELFRSRLAWITAILLFAVSPVQILYAQEAREYSLWACLIALASWALLRAIRSSSRRIWGLYAVIMGLLFWTSLLSALVAIAHGLYGLKAFHKQQWRAWLASMGGALILFLPWLMNLIVQATRFQSVTAWTLSPYPRKLLLKLWGLHFSAVFFDPNLPLSHPFTYLVPPLVIIGIGISLYVCWRQFGANTGWFLVTLLAVPTFALIGGDLIRGSRLSSETRYFFPVLLAAQLAIAGWFSVQMRTPFHRRWATIGLAALLTLSSINSWVMVNAPTWWNKRVGMHNYALAEAIAATELPLVLAQNADVTLGDLISLSYQLPPETQFQVAHPPDIPAPATPGRSLLLFYPSSELQQAYPCAEPLPGILANLWHVPCR